MMNKSANHVCSTTGGLHPTVFDLLAPEEHRKFLGGELHTVGRLDVDTEGLLILTTDGALTHRLTSPKYHCSKKYLVYLRDRVSDEDKISYAQQLAKGVHIAKDDNDPEADCLPAEIEWVDESSFAEKPAASCAVLPFESIAFEQHKNLDIEIPKIPIPVVADENKIKQIIIILTDNALKNSDSGATIKISAGIEGSRRFVKVYNTGTGIAPQDLDKLFNRFYRADSSRNRNTGGYGLGLAIAQTIAVAHEV